MKLLINNWRWAGVPFYIRTGKRLKKRVTEIAIAFKKAPSIMFQKTQTQEVSANLLILHIQPEEGISLRFGAKVPGPLVRIGDVDMRFQYKDYFGLKLGTGYETLLYDCMMAIKRFISVPTWSNQAGASYNPFSTCGVHLNQRIFRPMNLALKVQAKPTGF